MADAVPFRARTEFPLLFGSTARAESLRVVFEHDNKEVAKHVLDEARKVAFALFHLQVAHAHINRNSLGVLKMLAVAIAAERGVGTDDAGVFKASEAFKIVVGMASRNSSRLGVWLTRVKEVKAALVKCDMTELMEAYGRESALRASAAKRGACARRRQPRAGVVREPRSRYHVHHVAKPARRERLAGFAQDDVTPARTEVSDLES